MTPEEMEQQRGELASLVPDAILAIARCLKNPGRNAQTQLAAAKTILDRAGLPAVAATKISGDPDNPLQTRVVIEVVDSPAQIAGVAQKQLEAVKPGCSTCGSTDHDTCHPGFK